MKSITAKLVKVCSEAEITEIVQLASEIWKEHYTPIIGSEQVEYMLEMFQSNRAITEQINHSYEYYLLSKDQNSAGYFAVVPEDNKMMLSKIYVKSKFRGMGLGQQMLERAEKTCQERGISTIWLTVNKNNNDSIAWYTRMGFKNTGPVVMNIGNGFIMDDYRLEKTLDA